MAKAFRELVGVPPSTASTSDSVLVIIDAQNEYADGILTTANVTQTRAALARLVTKYRTAGAPIVHVLHRTPAGAPIFTTGTALSEEFDELAPSEKEKEKEKVIHKQHPGAFSGTDLQPFLASTGRPKIVLTGYMAHVCVSTTARQAAELGFDVVVPRDAVGDRDIPGVAAEELVRVALAELADAFGTVVNSDEIN
ncbi:isochorismatase family protein [Phlyctema vagabunda]|uniref:Isochorismatase family protein n=1 Tax=Phlyctema vagabunda TaxID=108571 RepID=A0ABR4PHU1_9HELO